MEDLGLEWAEGHGGWVGIGVRPTEAGTHRSGTAQAPGKSRGPNRDLPWRPRGGSISGDLRNIGREILPGRHGCLNLGEGKYFMLRVNPFGTPLAFVNKGGKELFFCSALVTATTGGDRTREPRPLLLPCFPDNPLLLHFFGFMGSQKPVDASTATKNNFERSVANRPSPQKK